MSNETKLSQIFKVGKLNCPIDNSQEYFQIISGNDSKINIITAIVLENIKEFDDFSLINHSKKRNITNLNNSCNEGNNFKIAKIISKPPKVTKVPIYEMKKYDKKSQRELKEEIEKLKVQIEELNKEDPKVNTKIDYFNLKKEKWIKFSQEAIYETLKMFPYTVNNERNTIINVINRLKINKELIRYDEESEDFL